MWAIGDLDLQAIPQFTAFTTFLTWLSLLEPGNLTASSLRQATTQILTGGLHFQPSWGCAWSPHTICGLQRLSHQDNMAPFSAGLLMQAGT